MFYSTSSALTGFECSCFLLDHIITRAKPIKDIKTTCIETEIESINLLGIFIYDLLIVYWFCYFQI